MLYTKSEFRCPEIVMLLFVHQKLMHELKKTPFIVAAHYTQSKKTWVGSYGRVLLSRVLLKLLSFLRPYSNQSILYLTSSTPDWLLIDTFRCLDMGSRNMETERFLL